MRIADLLTNALVDADAHLAPERVRRYVEEPDQPPVVVFETAEGLLLADGYHRVAAARLRGEETVVAAVRKGSRHDALRYAAVTGAAQRGITVEQALGRIVATRA
jgi:ParB-like chromosome segregation protein Spo0J